MSTRTLECIGRLNRRYVDEGKIAGMLTAVLRDGKLVHQSACGSTSATDPTPLSMDALVRIHSLTKPVTAVAAMQLLEQGKFRLKDPVAKYIPEFQEMTVLKNGKAEPAGKKMTMLNLLTHTAGLSYGADPRDPVDRMYQQADLWKSKDLDEFAARVARLPLKHEPGAQWHYSVALDLTGLVIQRISGLPLNEYLAKNIFQPLNMVDTSFEVPEEKSGRLLPMNIRDRNTGKACVATSSALPQGSKPRSLNDSALMHDYYNVTLYTGGGGLVSTMRDYTRFAEAIRAGGALDGERILGKKTVDYMAMDHLSFLSRRGNPGGSMPVAAGSFKGGFGLGVAVATDPDSTSIDCRPGKLNFYSVAGATCWIDPAEDIVIVSLMQLLNPWSSYAKELRATTYQAIEESKVRN